jgi:hypothetical protein
MSDMTYPKPGFPKVGDGSIEDWVPVDGQWHHLLRVQKAPDIQPDLYVDGVLVPASGETAPGVWDRALSRAQIERIYEEGTTSVTVKSPD